MNRRAVRRLAGLGLASMAFLTGGSSSFAATEIAVDCGSGADLQAAINAAPKGAILDISGRCVGSFTVAKNLMLRGASAAVLDAGSSSSGSTTDPALTISSGTVKVKTLTITGANTSSFLNDGGLVNFGTATLVRATVEGNSGEVAGITNRGTITLQRTIVRSNDAEEDVGGILNLGAATIQQSTIGPNLGTGVWNGSFSGTTPGTLSLVASTVTGNRSGAGRGGVWNTAGSVTILRSTIAKNAVFNSGPGGVGNLATMTIVESTISDNFGDEETGGLFTSNGGTTTIAATILSGNHYGGASDCGGPLTSAGYNLIGSTTADTTCSYTARSTDQTGVLDPLLNALGSYGGPTQTMVPKTTSPAVNKIPVGATSSDGTMPLCPSSGTTDQRGIPRPQGSGCDIGSVERKPKE